MADLPVGDLPRAEADQRHRAGRDGDRVPARLRHRLRHQWRQERIGAAVRAGLRQHRRRGLADRLRLRARHHPAGDRPRVHHHLPRPELPLGAEGMTVVATPARIEAGRKAKRRARRSRVGLHVFLAAIAVLFLFPILYAVYTSLRPYSDTAEHGYISIAHKLTFANYKTAWTNADLPHFYLNSLIITVPAILLTLLLASFVAFGVARFNWKFNLALLMLFTAGNLLPQQVIITPLYRLYLEIPLPSFMSDSGTLYDSYYGIVLIHVAFQLGFCVFVLSNYMKTLPMELSEAAMVDGASVWLQSRKTPLPLCRPPLAALATLEFTWIYNDFFWAQVLMQTGEKRPVTSALNNLQGQFFVNNNLIAAGALLPAIPTLIVYFVLQRQFVGGLTLGANKG